MSGFHLHPEAYTDVDELWEFIAEDSADNADRVRDKIYEAFNPLCVFRTAVTGEQTLPHALCAFGAFTITSSPMRLTRSHCGSWL